MYEAKLVSLRIPTICRIEIRSVFSIAWLAFVCTPFGNSKLPNFAHQRRGIREKTYLDTVAPSRRQAIHRDLHQELGPPAIRISPAYTWGRAAVPIRHLNQTQFRQYGIVKNYQTSKVSGTNVYMTEHRLVRLNIPYPMVAAHLCCWSLRNTGTATRRRVWQVWDNP